MLSKGKIKSLRSLSTIKGRKLNRQFIVEGIKIIKDIATSKLNIVEIYGTAKALETLDSEGIDQYLKNTPITEADIDSISKVSNLKTSSSIFAVVEQPELSLNLDDCKGELTLALDNIQDPGNLGTIIRLADWFGIENIICSINTADSFNPKVVQATMGAISRVKVHYCNLEETLTDIANLNIPIYGTTLEGKNIYSSSLPSEAIIIMGNEGKGISESVLNRVTEELLIPSFTKGDGCSESLNVAIATSIVCSEFRRVQR